MDPRGGITKNPAVRVGPAAGAGTDSQWVYLLACFDKGHLYESLQKEKLESGEWAILQTQDLPATLRSATAELLRAFGRGYRVYGDPYYMFVDRTGEVSGQAFIDAHYGTFPDIVQLAIYYHGNEEAPVEDGIALLDSVFWVESNPSHGGWEVFRK